MGTIQERTDEARFQEFKTLLERHDWWYVMSDDHRKYTSGRDQAVKIKAIYFDLCQIDKKRTEELYLAYCPYENKTLPECWNKKAYGGGAE